MDPPTEPDLLSRLPQHIAIYILSLLDAHSLLVASRVSGPWLALCRVTLVEARDYRDPWWLHGHNWSHLAALSEVLDGRGSEARAPGGAAATREAMLREVGGQLRDMRRCLDAEWRRFGLDIAAQLELDPWGALQPDLLVGQLRGRPRDA